MKRKIAVGIAGAAIAFVCGAPERAEAASKITRAMARPAAAPVARPAGAAVHVDDLDKQLNAFEIQHPPRGDKLEKPSAKSWWKLVSHLWNRVVDWVLDQVMRGINYVKAKVMKGLKSVFAVLRDKILKPAKEMITKTFEAIVRPVIERIPFDEIEQIAELFKGTKLDQERVRQRVYDIVMAFVRPHIKPRVTEAFRTVLATVKQFIESGVTGACSVVAEVPFVGGVLGGAILVAFSFLFDFTVNMIVNELLHWVDKVLLKPIVMRLIGPFLPTIVKWINKAMQMTGLGKLLAATKDAWGKLKNGVALLRAVTKDVYDKAKTVSAALQKELEEVAQERVVAEQDLGSLLAHVGASGLKL